MRNSPAFMLGAGLLVLAWIMPLTVPAVAEDASGKGKGEVSSELRSLIDLICQDAGNFEEQGATDDYDENITEDVLDYLSAVYSDHGFYESGGWAKVSPLQLSRRDSRLKPYASNSGADLRNIGVYSPPAAELPHFMTRDFYLPVKGRLTSGYGYRPRFGRIHKGIDVSLHIGDTVRCALPGVVSKVSYEAKGYGNYVVVTHSGGYETRYAHMSRTIVSPGDRVRPGDAVGLGGSTGNSTGPHLHFEIRYNGEALDPLGCFGLSEVYR